MHGVGKLLTGLSLTGLAVAGGVAFTGTAVGATSGTAQAGRVVFYQNPNFTGPTSSVSYAGCSSVAVYPPGLTMISAFDNRPPADCQVALVNRTGATTVLCAGRGLVPDGFRQPRQVLVRAGFSRPCGIGV
ncbi:hypothetical protein [Actinomadura sp. 6N118]|uniref:hypothetical protein n=1 Tax=Actinomadura sp. 6N118 TaxID=3375151 RepID=UPI003793C4D2